MPGQNSGSLAVAGARRRRAGLERGLDGDGDELRGLRVDSDVPAEQHPADHLPGVPGRVLWNRVPAVRTSRSSSSAATASLRARALACPSAFAGE